MSWASFIMPVLGVGPAHTSLHCLFPFACMCLCVLRICVSVFVTMCANVTVHAFVWTMVCQCACESLILRQMDAELSCQLTQWSVLVLMPPAMHVGVMRSDRRGTVLSRALPHPIVSPITARLLQGHYTKLRELRHMLTNVSQMADMTYTSYEPCYFYNAFLNW